MEPEFQPIPPGQARSRKDTAWYSGPFFIVGIFLVVHIAAGLRMAPSLKVLAGVAGLALAIASARGIARPVSTALFWGGLFLAWTNRGFGWAPVGLGAFVALAGAAAYLLRAPRPHP